MVQTNSHHCQSQNLQQGPDEDGIDAIETLIVPRARDLGGFEVWRALPAPSGRWWDHSSSSTKPARPT